MSEIQIKNLDLNLLEVFRVLVEEGSVNRAAERLGRTASAVSHALGRLREQIGDPLLVRIQGKMQPSPRGEALFREIGPLLAQMERALQPPIPFEPATSTRLFRVSAPATSIVTIVTQAIAAEAPSARVEWTPPQQTTFEQILNEEADLALGIANVPVPEGLAEQRFQEQTRFVLARQAHPAIAHWGLDEWLRWPHVVVRIPAATRGTVSEGFEQNGLERVVGARVPHWGAIAPILRGTNMLSNQVISMFSDENELRELAVLEAPLPMPQLPMRIVWSKRQENDPAISWLRKTAYRCFVDHLSRSHETLERVGIVKAVTR